MGRRVVTTSVPTKLCVLLLLACHFRAAAPHLSELRPIVEMHDAVRRDVGPYGTTPLDEQRATSSSSEESRALASLQDLDREVRARIFEPAVLAVLDRCQCRMAYRPDGQVYTRKMKGGSQKNNNFMMIKGKVVPPRLYVFDTAGTVPSGLNHQISNLRAILAEGLSLGRAVLLRKPTLTKDHNFDKPFRHNMWGHFIAFNASTYSLTTHRPGSSVPGGCRGKLDDCVADVSESQLRALAALPLTTATYHNGTVSKDANARPGVLVRSPVVEWPSAATSSSSSGSSSSASVAAIVPGGSSGNNNIGGVVDDPDDLAPALERTALIRKLPGFGHTMSTHQLRLTLRAPDSVLRHVPPVMSWLRKASKTGRIAVVHVRRGDKITNKKYCPKEMRLATAPDNIAKVLDSVGVPTGSGIYIMSDETDFNHFRPLRDVHGYAIATNAHFPHLHSLLAGCSGEGAAQGLPCENYLLFAIEKEILNAVPPVSRIVTLPRHDLTHNNHHLMTDFLGPNKPCRSL